MTTGIYDLVFIHSFPKGFKIDSKNEVSNAISCISQKFDENKDRDARASIFLSLFPYPGSQC